jgi:hypothetical protein
VQRRVYGTPNNSCWGNPERVEENVVGGVGAGFKPAHDDNDDNDDNDGNGVRATAAMV